MHCRFRVRSLNRLNGFTSIGVKPAGDQTRRRPFCTTKNNKDNKTPTESESESDKAHVAHYHDSYRQLQNLDFMTAAKIAFSEPPKKKKFGLDFHLVQLFFALLPSFAVYLVAKYARSEMTRMDAELEAKKKKVEEERAKEAELKEAAEREKARNAPEILEVRARLDKLEQVLNEVVVESKKQPATEKRHDTDGVKKQLGRTESSSKDSPSEAGKKL